MSTNSPNDVIDLRGKGAERFVCFTVRTRDGIEFDSRAGLWPITENQSLDVDSLRALMSPALLPGLEATLRDACTKYSWSTVTQHRFALKHFHKSFFPSALVASWEITDFKRYRTALLAEFGHEDYLRHLRSFLVLWHRGGHPGVTSSLVADLQEMRLKGVEPGRAVRTMDPREGPLTPEESHHLLQGLSDAAESGKLTLHDFSLAYLHLCTGRRPVQSASMKCKDVIETRGDPEPGHPDGPLLYMLAIPRAKQRGHTFRETRRAIDLTPANFQVFRAQREDVQGTFAELLKRSGWELQPRDLQALQSELPLYPTWSAIAESVKSATELRESGEHGKALESLRLNAAGRAWHTPAPTQGARIVTICSSVGAIGRDGEVLSVSAARLRHSKGTDLAREGLPAHLIAWLLDHSTSRSAELYVNNLPEHAAEIDRAISKSPTLQRFASAFRGDLVDSETEAVGGNDPQSRLAYRGIGTATCGHLKQCGLDGGIPHACYTCSHFQPWLDGPHEEFLGELLAEREALTAQLGTDSPVAKRRDKLIGAVQNVVQLCQARRAELESAEVEGGQA